MGQQRTAGALAAMRLVQRAADGDGQAWERLIDQYQELVVAIHRDQLAGDDETLPEAPAQGPPVQGPLRAARRPRPAGDALCSLPLRWQQLLLLLLADPSAQHARQMQ